METTIILTKPEAAMLLELLTHAAAKGPDAKTLASLFGKAQVAVQQLLEAK
jgi:hypothetical protein